MILSKNKLIEQLQKNQLALTQGFEGNTEDYITHHDPVLREKHREKANKITNKDGQLTYQIPSYPNYWSLNLLN